MSFSLQSVKEVRGVKIVHINVRSLLQHFDELYISFLDGAFDIVVFTESWLHSNCSDSLISVPGYRHFKLDRRSQTKSGAVKKGGGIVVYVKDTVEVVTWANLDSSDIEPEVLSLSCKVGHRRRVNLTAVYRPPTGNVQIALDRLEGIIENIRLSISGDTVLTGDLNVDLLNDNALTKKINQFCNATRLEHIVTEATRVSNRSCTTDHIYYNICHQDLIGVNNSNISDHLPVFLVIKKPCNSQFPIQTSLW